MTLTSVDAIERRRQLDRDLRVDRQDAIKAIKESHPCADCGKFYPFYVMDFDHVRGEKLFNISNDAFRLTKTLQEIEKCDVVCANCHRIREYARHCEEKP